MSLESVNSLGRVEGYTFIFPPGSLSDPETIKGVWLAMPTGIEAWFVRTHHWRKVKKEGAELAEIRGSDSAEVPALADTSLAPSLEIRSQRNPV